MKISSVLFLVLAVCYLIAGVVYRSYTDEPAGFVMLIALFLFALALAGFVFVTLRSLPGPLPEDRADADMEDATGPIIYFPTSSVWPLALALGVAGIGLGLVVGLWWTLLGGMVLVVGVVGYTRESALAASNRPDPGAPSLGEESPGVEPGRTDP